VRRTTVRRLLKRIEAALAAIAFAEADEHETARSMVAEAEQDAAAPPRSSPRGRARRPGFPREKIARLP
jgi:hypothetical protein